MFSGAFAAGETTIARAEIAGAEDAIMLGQSAVFFFGFPPL